MGVADERAVPPRAADEGKADRQAGDIAGGHGDARIAGDGGETRTAAEAVVAVHEVDGPGHRRGRHDQGVEPELADGPVDAVFPREAAACGERLQIGRVIRPDGPVARLLGGDQLFLPEPGHDPVGIVEIEPDQVGEGVDRAFGPERREPGVQPGLELGPHHQDFVGPDGLARGHRHLVDDDGARIRQHFERAFEHPVHRFVEAAITAHDADPRALQRAGVEETGEILLRRRPGGRVVRVGSGQRAEQDRRVGDRARHRARRVLARGDGNDSGAGDQAEGRLDSHDGIHRGRPDNGPVGLRADSGRRKVARDRHAGAGTGAAGRPVGRIGVADLPAAARPAAGRARGTEVRPFAEIGLAEQHRAGLAQAPGDMAVRLGPHAVERERAGRGHHGVAGRDIVLQQHRHAVHRAAHMAGGALAVARLSDFERVGIEEGDGPEGPVLRFDPLAEGLDEIG